MPNRDQNFIFLLKTLNYITFDITQYISTYYLHYYKGVDKIYLCKQYREQYLVPFYFSWLLGTISKNHVGE